MGSGCAGIKVGLILVVIGMLWSVGDAQSCTTALVSLAPCLNYLTGNSSTPSSSCCSQLKSVLQSSPQCLCSAVNGGATLGFAINRTLALQLPRACKLQTPSVTQCSNAGTPTPTPNPPEASPTPNPPEASPIPNPSEASPTPGGSPSDSSNGSVSPSPSQIPSGTGSKSVPSINGGSSNSSILKSSFHLAIFLLCVANIAKF